MLFVETYIDDSEIEGKGLFSKQNIRKGSIIGILAYMADIMSEMDYIKFIENGNYIINQTGVRWIGNIFLYGKELENEDYINHSFQPNMIYHCGILIAREDIYKGNELTVDYRYFLSANEKDGFLDKITGKIVYGYNPTEAFINSLQEIISIQENLDLNADLNRLLLDYDI